MTAATAVHSNAFNFLSFVQTGVDPRTGLYTVSVSLPEVKTNDLSGPAVPLTLTFNPLNTLDSGFGLGWNLALTQYTPSNQVLSVHSGESFKVTSRAPGNPARMLMKEQKIENFQLYDISGDPRGDFKVVHKSGLVEILKLMGPTPQIAMPVHQYSPQGHGVTLSYGEGNLPRMLRTVRDDQRQLLAVIRNTTAKTVEFHLPAVGGEPSERVLMHLEGDRVSRITLPTNNDAGWRFDYEPVRELLCIKDVWTPMGGRETLQYGDAGHAFPGDGGQQNVARVTRHVTDPGAGQPVATVDYTYSSNNFLGYNSPIDWTDDGLDNLYKVIGDYTYEVTERLMVNQLAVRTTTHTFNRFHLQTSLLTTQGNHRKTVTTTYYANDTDTFDNQVRQCQLPKRVATLWDLTDDPRTWRHDKELNEYDIHGNQTLKVQANGIREVSSWYPADGLPGDCPPDPYGFVRHLQSRTVFPASDATLIPELQDGAPILQTLYRYISQPAIAASASQTPWVALAEEQLQELDSAQARLLQRCAYRYFNTPADPLSHGRRQQQALTFADNPDHTLVTDYRYSKKKPTHATVDGETVLVTEQTLSSLFDNVSKHTTEERSLLNGEPLLLSDQDEQLRFTYDALGRVLTETEAPDTEYAATRTFRYRLIRPAGRGETPVTDLPGQELKDVKGVRTQTWFDGLSRAVREALQDHDNADGNPPVYRDIYTAQYDALGQLSEETEIDWLEKTDLRLTRRFSYDLWGQQASVTGADGITRHSHNNPLTFIHEQWTEGMGKTITLNNRFDKPLSTEQQDLAGNRLSLQRYRYDGLGNCTEEIDPLGRVSRHRYDSWGRLLSSTLPDLTVINHTYAPHSTAALATSLAVKPGNKLRPAVTVGEQRFDGLSRLTRLTVGDRVEQLEYEGARLQPSRRQTPSGKQLTYQYRHGLTTEPTVIEAPDENATFNYDPANGNLDRSSNTQGSYAFTYSATGHLTDETWTEPGKTTWHTRYISSLKGRQLSCTDIAGQTTVAEYDVSANTGRLLRINQGQLQGDFEYDTCGRLHRTTRTDLGTGNTLTTALDFDDIGRETRRTLTLSDRQGQPLQPEQQIDLTYLADGNLATCHRQIAGQTVLLETYHYDLRGRLELYECAGTELPEDRFANAIVRQFYEFDALDNIIYTRTDFADGSQDIAEFGFASADPCQLVSASHSHPSYQALRSDYAYDADGNLALDELGQQLNYDSQGRLLAVKTAAGQALSTYRYDAHNHLLGVTALGSAEALRFYQADNVSHTVQDGHHTQWLYHGTQPLGQQTPGDPSKTLLLLTDAKHSVIGELEGTDLRTAVYSAYGERSSDEPLNSLPGFNGEVRDPASGWYLLGRGYRAYNPGLMRFHSPDSLSPFGAGGINCYMYCTGNPIAFSDPTGRSQIINNPWFNAGVAAATTVLGIVLSIVTWNPGPLISAVIASAASTATTTALALGASASVAAMAGAVATAAVTAAPAAITWGATAAAMGVEGVAMFTRDQRTRETLGWIGLGLSAIALPNFKAFKPPAPKPVIHSASPAPILRSSASSASVSSASSSGSIRSSSSGTDTSRTFGFLTESDITGAMSGVVQSNWRLAAAAKSGGVQAPRTYGLPAHTPSKSMQEGILASLGEKAVAPPSPTPALERYVPDNTVLKGQDYFRGRQNVHKPRVLPVI
ncbi:RHS repeat-associated core domain-containing protein [Pseudomonas taetrolens]|uniref:RHS repeat-associated core domain-containing protein n=1 Tax=Pseudomonas taetrolens TaxID=47884 RepID=A0A1H4T703_PSETA|nr:RHS repeat-associated core domain-containing protein [Pseudomonas taetrolens]SEC52235.1 RHS repeat-associated core domain-containing protein [Pseudomonas taetrolens]SQF86724.1 YD repeat protein [Pseudomonas taetrolens]VEH49800.1 YD repeat protein [Pseudomonas taetrolens]